jgi:hypothetical protein
LSKRKIKTGAKKRNPGKVTAMKLSEIIVKRGLPDVPENRPHSSVNS